jgi:GWxTD domain-containing protein
LSNPLKRTSPAKMIRSAIRTALVVSCFLPSFLSLSCKTIGQVRALDKGSRDFYSQVRYIISRKEKKIFLELPPADRGKFVEEFWKRRDPSPETAENEFKEEYLARIRTANKLFRGGGKEGFIQDRGRIFILLGPPDERDTEAVGKFANAKSYEIWNYQIHHQIQLTFVDLSGDGEYALMRPDTRVLQIINSAQTRLQNPGPSDEELLDFSAEVKHEETVFLLIKIPYKNFWFKDAGENELADTLAVDLKVIDASGKEIWRHQKDYDLVVREEDAKKLSGKEYSIRIPLDLEKGSYTADLTLDDRVGERTQKKRLAFTIE